MEWEKHIAELAAGRSVKFRPRGNSMIPRIYSGNEITVEPVQESQLKANDIVFCKVKGFYFIHLISAVSNKGFQISNNRGHINGTIKFSQIYGKVTEVRE